VQASGAKEKIVNHEKAEARKGSSKKWSTDTRQRWNERHGRFITPASSSGILHRHTLTQTHTSSKLMIIAIIIIIIAGHLMSAARKYPFSSLAICSCVCYYCTASASSFRVLW
jgi:hypothetical protein